MSCIVVSPYHVDVLVSWAVDHRAPAFFDGLTPALLAECLAEKNRAAYAERYRDNDFPPLPRYRPRPSRGLSPVQVIKACDCLNYQCSDWSDWEESRAHKALMRIREHAIARLPGYEDARWVLDEEQTA